MLRPRQALFLMAVMLWQALSWVTPLLVETQSQRIAHLVIHETSVDHHHGASVQVQDADNDGVHLHADGGLQPMGLAVRTDTMAALALPGLPPRAVFSCPPSICLDGLLRPPQATA